MANEPDSLGGSLSKGLRVLASFDERDARLTVAEISERTSINRASVYRLAGVLEQQGYLKKEGSTYQPSSKVFGLGVAAVESLELVDHIRPHLDRIKNELSEATAINYGVLEGDEVIYLLRLHLDNVISINLQVGSRLPVYLSSLGKAILSAMPPEEAEAVVARIEFDPRTPNTAHGPEQLRRDLQQAREDGVAVNDEELTPGLSSVAAAVFRGSDVVGAVNVATLSARTDVETLKHQYGVLLKTVADEISADISLYGN